MKQRLHVLTIVILVGVFASVLLAAGLLAGCGGDQMTAPTTANGGATSTEPGTGEYPQEVYTILQGMGGAGFDLDAWKATAAAEKIIASARNGFLYPDEMDPAVLAYWEALGLKKEVHDSDDNDQRWYSYAPLQALTTGTDDVYPVMFSFSQEGTGMVELGAEEGFITVRPVNLAVPRGGEFPADGLTPGRQVVGILDALEDEGYPIDRSRVYATGHSIGGMASAWASLEFPEVVTAIAMHSSLLAFNTDETATLSIPADQFAKAMDYDIPVWLAVGDADLDQLPIRTDGTIHGLNLWLQVDDCPTQLTLEDSLADASSSTDPAEKLIGVAGDETWTETIDGVVYHGVEFFQTDGVTMVEIVGVENHPHWVTAAYPELAWEFLSRFSKDADGNLVVTE